MANLSVGGTICILLGFSYHVYTGTNFYVAKLGYAGVYPFVVFWLQNIDCGYSIEPCTHNLCLEQKILEI